MNKAQEIVRKRLKQPQKPLGTVLLTTSGSDWVKEQFMNKETAKEHFEKRYVGFWPERMETMDPIDQILNYMDMNIVALETHEREKLRKYLIENFFIQEGIKEE